MVSFQLADVFTVGFQISLCSISNSRTMNTIDHLKLLSFITWCHLPRYFDPNLCCKITILSMNQGIFEHETSIHVFYEINSS